MTGTKTFVLGGLTAIVGIAGLFVSAHSHDHLSYGAGLAIAGLALALDFWLLKRWFDRADAAG